MRGIVKPFRRPPQSAGPPATTGRIRDPKGGFAIGGPADNFISGGPAGRLSGSVADMVAGDGAVGLQGGEGRVAEQIRGPGP